jgi:hypothetical protein
MTYLLLSYHMYPSSEKARALPIVQYLDTDLPINALPKILINYERFPLGDYRPVPGVVVHGGGLLPPPPPPPAAASVVRRGASLRAAAAAAGGDDRRCRSTRSEFLSSLATSSSAVLSFAILPEASHAAEDGTAGGAGGATTTKTTTTTATSVRSIAGCDPDQDDCVSTANIRDAKGSYR